MKTSPIEEFVSALAIAALAKATGRTWDDKVTGKTTSHKLPKSPSPRKVAAHAVG